VFESAIVDKEYGLNDQGQVILVSSHLYRFTQLYIIRKFMMLS
jgi:hypothetical protein